MELVLGDFTRCYHRSGQPKFQGFRSASGMVKMAGWSCLDPVDSICVDRNREICGSYMGVGTSLESWVFGMMCGLAKNTRLATGITF